MKHFLNDKGQGTVEYTLLVGLVAVIIWAVISNTQIVQTVTAIWGGVDATIPAGPSLSASAGSTGGAAGVSGSAGGGAGARSTAGVGNDENVDLQRSAAKDQPTQEEGLGEQNSTENAGDAQETALSAGGVIGKVSSISESQWHNPSMGLGLALFALIAAVIPLIVWMRIKSVEKSEVSFQGLQADQIVAKIKETA